MKRPTVSLVLLFFFFVPQEDIKQTAKSFWVMGVVGCIKFLWGPLPANWWPLVLLLKSHCWYVLINIHVVLFFLPAVTVLSSGLVYGRAACQQGMPFIEQDQRGSWCRACHPDTAGCLRRWTFSLEITMKLDWSLHWGHQKIRHRTSIPKDNEWRCHATVGGKKKA